MLTRNIEFTDYQNNKNNSKINFIFKNLKKNFLNKSDKLLLSFSNKYQYSFIFKKIKKYKKHKIINIIGMGGSVLGAQAIYSFLRFKIKKNFFFLNNLKLKNKIENSNELNLVISKSGNTLETISNYHNLNKKKKITIYS